MDADTAKEIEDLQNNLKALVNRKRKREEAALQHENEQLKNEIQKLKTKNRQCESDYHRIAGKLRVERQRATSGVRERAQAHLELTEFKQRNKELDADNKRLKNKLDQQDCGKAFRDRLRDELHDELAEQAETIKAHSEEIRVLKVENRGLQTRLDKLQQYKTASQKAVSNLKAKRRLDLEAEFKLLVSHHIKGYEVIWLFQIF